MPNAGFKKRISAQRAKPGELTLPIRQERLFHVERLSTLGEIASGLAHEISQPLAAITTYAQAAARMLHGSSAPPEVLTALDEISGQALRAGDVLRRMRALVKRHDDVFVAFDPNGTIRELLILLEPIASTHDVSLTVQLHEPLPPVHGDPIQIQHVVMNLVRNAIDAIVNSAAAGAREVTIESRLAGDAVWIGVHDSGPGVPDIVARELFRPFYTTKTSGTGLGLAVSHSIVERHAGRLAFENRPGGGATFYFTLPATQL